MAKRIQYRRLLMLALLIVAAFAGLGYRLVDLQVLRHAELSALALQNTQREFVLQPRRGDILDCRENLLATSVYVKMVCADPSLMGNGQAEVARALAPLLQMNEADLYQRLLPRTWRNDKGEIVTNQFVRLKRKVPVETWHEIQAAMSHLSLGGDDRKLTPSQQIALRQLRRSVFAREDQMRVYPNGPLAAHVLGFVGSVDRDVNGMPVPIMVGRDGIELTMDSELRGIPGWRVTETDHRGQELVPMRGQDVEACDGLDVVLSIDSVIQHFVESALARGMEKCRPISITGIVVRPSTGEILAMATLPSFDPNDPGAAPADARRDRVITDVMEPGSVFKIVTVSGVLNEHLVTLNDVFNCEHGHFLYAGRVLHDHAPFDLLTVKQIITKSSNIGAAKLGIKLGDRRLYDYIKRYGFGECTGLPLPGEVRGIVHPVRDWSKVTVAQLPMGQGVAVTRLQMVMAMAAIANHGRLMHPMLVERLEDQNGNVVARYAPQPVRQVVTPETAALMVQALKTVVSPEGTAPEAALEHYTVAGKTGTAQKVENGHYVHGQYFASFIGFFPASDPQLCISVVLDDPKVGFYGGSVAGPVFKEIAQRAASYLNIPPDINPLLPGDPAAQTAEPSRRTVAAARHHFSR